MTTQLCIHIFEQRTVWQFAFSVMWQPLCTFQLQGVVLNMSRLLTFPCFDWSLEIDFKYLLLKLPTCFTWGFNKGCAIRKLHLEDVVNSEAVCNEYNVHDSKCQFSKWKEMFRRNIYYRQAMIQRSPLSHLEPAYKGTSVRNKLRVSNKRIVLPSYQVLSLTSLRSTSRKPSNGWLSHIMCPE